MPTKTTVKACAGYNENISYANIKKEMLSRPQTYKENCYHLGNAGSGRSSFSREEHTHQVVVQHQMVIPESLHLNDIFQTKHFVFRDAYIHVHVYIYT